MTTFRSGQWNALCDRCGFKFKSSELRKDWQGLMVCDKDFERRHPQDFIKVKPETALPEWTRPKLPEEYLPICYVWSSSGYADLGTADCLQADNAAFPYPYLRELSGT